MKLEKKTYKRKEIAEWFGITPKTFTDSKKEKLEELKEYADYTLNYSQAGYLMSITITEVKYDTYGELKIKNKFFEWLNKGGIQEVILNQMDQEEVINYSVVTNYYCFHNNIPYDGPHYIKVQMEGRTLDNKRSIKGYISQPNQEYKQWHYLYNLLKQWTKKNNFRLENCYIDCCADSFNPTKLKITTQTDIDVRQKIYDKWFGRVYTQDAIELVDYITDYPESYIDKEELEQLKLCRRLSDKEKRIAAARECADNGVLRRNGYFISINGEEDEIVFSEGEHFDF